ncbi:GDP-fucose protein O-fucosyltransferase 2 [Asimina triloba]
MSLKSLNYVVSMLGLGLLLLFLSGFLPFPSALPSIPSVESKTENSASPSPPNDGFGAKDPFTNVLGAFRKWDAKVGCAAFREKHRGAATNGSSLQDTDAKADCRRLKTAHVTVLVKSWTWVPDNLDNTYSCRCGLSCLWTKSAVLADKPDAMLYETARPPIQIEIVPVKLELKGIPLELDDVSFLLRLGFCNPHDAVHDCGEMYPILAMLELEVGCLRSRKVKLGRLWHLDVYRVSKSRSFLLSGLVAFLPPILLKGSTERHLVREKRKHEERRVGDPLRVYMDLEAGRKKSGFEDIFIGYHAKDDVQSTYAGGLFHNSRNYHVSSKKNNDTLVYWSSSRCLPDRNRLAKKLLSLLPHHSFGKCLNNVGGLDRALDLYPECANNANSAPSWWDHLHCAMSHYKFVLAVENTMTESYVTEKLFYALDAGAVPIYFGAPNVWDLVPPNSIIDGSKFKTLEDLASYVKALANDPVSYSEYHAWRRCGILGSYRRTRAVSLDTLPCRLCELDLLNANWKNGLVG